MHDMQPLPLFPYGAQQMLTAADIQPNPADPFITPEQVGPALAVPINRRQVYKWIDRGIDGADGTRIFLKSIRLGGLIYTRKMWVIQFLSAQAGHDLTDVLSPAPPEAVEQPTAMV